MLENNFKKCSQIKATQGLVFVKTNGLIVLDPRLVLNCSGLGRKTQKKTNLTGKAYLSLVNQIKCIKKKQNIHFYNTVANKKNLNRQKFRINSIL